MFAETKDHNKLKVFYEANGLEVSEDIVRDDGAVFSIKCEVGGRMLAAATLSRRMGVFILDYVAVDESERRKGLGEKAVRIITEKAEVLGADKLYITARNPEFFGNMGFKEGSPEGIDMNADCIGCPQFGNGCRKLPMYIDIV